MDRLSETVNFRCEPEIKKQLRDLAREKGVSMQVLMNAIVKRTLLVQRMKEKG